MMRLYYKPDEQYYDVYNVRDDKNGYPHFLIYINGQWIYKSAKLFSEYNEKEI